MSSGNEYYGIMAMPESLQQEALRNLTESEVCVCGSHKRKKMSFCYECYMALPWNLRRGLYKTISEGYAIAWDEARTYLQAETDRVKV